MQSMDRFNGVISELLSENGCPWDKAQTHESLKKYLLEECYEVIDAIDNNDYENLCEELGDVLFQVVIHSHIAEKEGKFTLDDVCNGVSDKMIRRHPNVFKRQKNGNIQEALQDWEKIKMEEKNYTDISGSMKGIAKSLPALMRAEKIQKKAEENNYKFENEFESTRELLNELENDNFLTDEQKSVKIGQILFNLSNISRKFKINSEFALTNCSEKFINRFEDIERGQNID